MLNELRYVEDILLRMFKEHPEICPHDYQWIGTTTNNEGEKIERYKCALCGKRRNRTRASLLGKNEEAHEEYIKPVKCKDCHYFIPYEKPVEDFDGRCIVRECETDEEEYCSYSTNGELLIGNYEDDYEQTIETIKHYKNKACEVAGNKCDKCEAAQEYNCKLWCAFDTVNRFVEWDNK